MEAAWAMIESVASAIDADPAMAAAAALGRPVIAGDDAWPGRGPGT